MRMNLKEPLKVAFGAAKWFGGSGLSLCYLLNPLNDGMASAAALIFGKWFPIVVFGVLATLGWLLSAIWLRVKDSSKRMFLLFWGAGMLAPAIYFGTQTKRGEILAAEGSLLVDQLQCGGRRVPAGREARVCGRCRFPEAERRSFRQACGASGVCRSREETEEGDIKSKSFLGSEAVYDGRHDEGKE